MNTSTFFTLMAEFGTGDIPVKIAAAKYFSVHNDGEQKKRAARQQYPIPAYRCGGQKSEWCFAVQDLANHIDKCRAAGHERWQTLNNVA